MRFATLVVATLVVLCLLAGCMRVLTEDVEINRLFTDLTFDEARITIRDEDGNVIKQVWIKGYTSEQIKAMEVMASGIAEGIIRGMGTGTVPGGPAP